MFYVKDKSIHLTRGDTAMLAISISNDVTGEAYIIQPNDTLKLSVKKTVYETEYGFQKVVVGSNAICIEPNDTKHLSFGKYLYDIELTTENGDVYTVIAPTTFEIMKEVS